MRRDELKGEAKELAIAVLENKELHMPVTLQLKTLALAYLVLCAILDAKENR